LWFCHKATVEF